MAKEGLRIIPLGGFGEVGKNMLVIEFGRDIIVVDAGLMFPLEEMLGVDLVIPDITYLLENRDRVRGIIVTHGHEDHTGALPYVLRQINAPVYAAKLTSALISHKLKEHHLQAKVKVNVIEAGRNFKLGCFQIEPFHMNHSIPDAVGLAISTPVGMLVHSGDFKIDYTPVDGKPVDLSRLAVLGSQNVLALLSDSTYADLPGYTPSEKVVGQALDRIVADAQGRVLIATFASLISRIQQVMDIAVKHGRTVVLAGRSMIDNVRICQELGYVHGPAGLVQPLESLHRLPPGKVVVLCTGSQGEPTSALVKMANQDHRFLKVMHGDTIVISASAIPGNEGVVSRTIDNLFRLGAEVLYDRVAQVHVHGHGSQEELKLLLNLTKPRFFIPMHGEYRNLVLHSKLAVSTGIPKSNIFVLEDGDVLEMKRDAARKLARIPVGNVYVDGLSVGDIGSIVLRDRKLLAADGIAVIVIPMNSTTGKLIGRPEIVSRGFVEASGESDLVEQARQVVTRSLEKGSGRPPEWSVINSRVRDSLGKFFYEKTRRRPMILPVAVEV